MQGTTNSRILIGRAREKRGNDGILPKKQRHIGESNHAIRPVHTSKAGFGQTGRVSLAKSCTLLKFWLNKRVIIGQNLHFFLVLAN